MLERNDYPGGYCSNFQRNDYRFESAIHAINGCGENGRTRRVLSECDVFSKLRFLKPPQLYRINFPDLDLSFPQEDISQYSDILSKQFPEEIDNIENFFAETNALFTETLVSDSNNVDSVGSSLIWKYKDLTLKDFLDQRFKNEKLKAILAQYWGYLGVPPSQLSAIYYLYMFWDYAANGAYYPEGGSEGVARQLEKEIIKSGSKVVFGAEVKHLISEDGKIIDRVLLKNGEEFHGTNFISNISAKKLFDEMIDGVKMPDKILNRTRTIEGSLSAFVLYLGLNKDVKDVGVDDYEIFSNPDYDLERHYAAVLNNDLVRTQLAITIYSNLDQTSCPRGKSVLSIFALANYDGWKELSRREYTIKKKELSEALIKRCENIIPNLGKLIDVIEVATPLTLENYSGSTKGAIYGWIQDISQSSFRRQKPVTPIKNLYLTGAWTRPGGGFSSVVYSGSIAANCVSPKYQEAFHET